MIVMKFGGSSVKDAEMFTKVSEIVKARIDKKPIIILSAVKGVTDNLILSLNESLEGKFDAYNEIAKKHKEILKNLNLDETAVDEELNELKEALEVNSKVKEDSTKMLDYISFFGERMSSKILAALLTSTGIKSEAFVSGDMGLITDSNFGDAAILVSSFEKMKEKISEVDSVPVITGFGGKDEKGEFTTFNRGGSDYVASLFGAAVDAKEIQIWTDVNGIMSCDPRIVENTRTIPELSFDEASELAYFGAKVLHPKTILPAVKKNIPVLVLNTFEPDHVGSRIVNESSTTNNGVKAISYKKGITILDVKSTRMFNAHGYLAKIFEIFKKYKRPVDMISTSEINVSISVDSNQDVDRIAEELDEISRVVVYENKAIVYVVGPSIKNRVGIVGKIFTLLAEKDIHIDMISQCSEKVSIGFVLDEEKAEETVKLLHNNLVH